MRVNPYGRRPGSNSDWDERPTRGGISGPSRGGGARSGTAGHKSETPNTPRGRIFGPEDEDQSASASGGYKAGLRVRHPQFGVGTVIAVEGGDADTQADRPVRQRRPEEADGPVREPGTGLTARPDYRPASRRSSVGAIAADQMA